MTKAEFFTNATRKNALRKDAGLPLLNIREEMAREAYVMALRRYNEGYERFIAIYRGFRDEALDAFRREKGEDFGNNAGAAMLVDYKALPRYRQFLAARGYPYPEPLTKIGYGESRD